MRFDEAAREEWTKPGVIEGVLQEKGDALEDLVRQVRLMPDVAYAAVVDYDTVVVGQENYDAYISRSNQTVDRSTGTDPWFGGPIRQGLEAAASRLRGDGRQDGGRGVSDADAQLQAGAGQILNSNR